MTPYPVMCTVHEQTSPGKPGWGFADRIIVLVIKHTSRTHSNRWTRHMGPALSCQPKQSVPLAIMDALIKENIHVFSLFSFIQRFFLGPGHRRTIL
jgi:hypothetical protein